MKWTTAVLLLGTVALGTRVAHAEGSDGCTADWAAAVYVRAKPSVVRIAVGNAEGGTGFFFADSCHVATALHVVDSARTIRIGLADGSVLPAEVVGTDSDHDLALLRLTTCPQNIAPLKTAARPAIGAPVMAIGNPYVATSEPTGLQEVPGLYQGLLAWSATTGVVSAQSDRFVQTDTAMLPGSSGGPLVDCRGDVLGIVDRVLAAGVGFAVSSKWLDALAQQALASPRPYAGNVRFSASVGLQFDLRSSDSYQGLSLSEAIIFHDRWWYGVRIAYLPWGGPGSQSGTATNPTFVGGASRVALDVAFGPRFLLFPFSPLVTYLQIAAGGGLAFDQGTVTQLSISPGGSAITSTTSDFHDTRWEPLGMIGFFAGSKGNLEISYSYRVDVERVASSTSQIAIALWL
jgi:S1-C subfamily serine protease